MFNVGVLSVKASLTGISYIKAEWQLQASMKFQEPWPMDIPKSSAIPMELVLEKLIQLEMINSSIETVDF